MGLFGEIGRILRPAGTARAPGAQVATDAMPAPDDPRRRLFGDGRAGGILSGVGKLLAYGPFAGLVQRAINRRLGEQAAMQRRRSGLESPNGVPGPDQDMAHLPQAGSLAPDAIERLRRNPAFAPYFDAE